MRVEKIQNTPQTFGMAYYLKSSKDINSNYYQYYIATKQMHVYAQLKNGVCARGYQQFQKEMGKLNFYDVAFDHETKSMQVIERATNEVVAIYEKSPRHKIGTEKKFPGRRIFAYFFNPKEFLPQNMLLAGEKAKELEQLALNKNKRF